MESAKPALDTELNRLEKSLYDLSDVYRKHKEYIKAKYKISALEMEILQYIVIEGKKKMKEIGKQFNLKLSTLTSIIDKIENQRLVKRVNSKTDRRVVYLEISRKGMKLYEDYSNYIHVISQMMQQSMDETQFQAFIQGLEKIAVIANPQSQN